MSYDDPTLLDALCDRVRAVGILFGIATMFLVLNVPLLFVYEWGSANSVVTVLNVVGSCVFVVGSYAAIRTCRERRDG